jgi:hypothetical protein
MYELADDKYVETGASGFFPKLTVSLLLEFLDLSKTQGQTSSLNAFRQRIRSSGR